MPIASAGSEAVRSCADVSASSRSFGAPRLSVHCDLATRRCAPDDALGRIPRHPMAARPLHKRSPDQGRGGSRDASAPHVTWVCGFPRHAPAVVRFARRKRSITHASGPSKADEKQGIDAVRPVERPMDTSCEHLNGLTASDFPPPRTPFACEECLIENTQWVALRECRTGPVVTSGAATPHRGDTRRDTSMRLSTPSGAR